MSVAAFDPPLASIRVVDAVRGPLAPITRHLAELGATVDRIVEASPGEDAFDMLAANSGKRLHASSEAADLLAAADLVVENVGLDTAELRAARPALVTMTVSDFGTGNAFSDWQASDAVLHALSGELSRSGIRGMAPLLPPHGIAYHCAATQAAYVAATSLYRALRTGAGDHIDFSALEGAVQALDPGFGIGGSATLGRPAKLLSRDRPVRGTQYPILPCADGHVRICLLSGRQWQGMFRWMGEPTAFADPAFNKTAVRYKSPELLPAIAAFFAGQTRAELEAGGKAHGVPIAALSTLEEAIEAEHFAARGSLHRVATDVGDVTLPTTTALIDGQRNAPDMPAAPAFPAPTDTPTSRAFEGLRVLDLGVIVVGAETSRLFADQDADVVKIESRAFPDGNRQSYLPYDLSVSFATGHRNKRSLGLDLRDPRGRETFLALVATADVLLSNFKPGTLESLGLDRATLATVNPRLVTVESSAFGRSGPWSRRMGYGPLVRAATGLTERWRYADAADGYSDSITIYPDHVAARAGALAAVALLIRRLRSDTGGEAEIAQAEVMLGHFAADVARASAGKDAAGPPDRPWGVYRAVGDDAWCVVSVRDDADWHALAPFLGLADDPRLATRNGRVAQAAALETAMGDWIATRTPAEAMAQLQAAGVPAAAMLRVAELPSFGFYVARDFYRTETHPYLDETFATEQRHAVSETLADAAARPAPLAGEHSEEVLADWVAMTAKARADLIAADVLQPVTAETLDHIARSRAA